MTVRSVLALAFAACLLMACGGGVRVESEGTPTNARDEAGARELPTTQRTDDLRLRALGSWTAGELIAWVSAPDAPAEAVRTDLARLAGVLVDVGRPDDARAVALELLQRPGLDVVEAAEAQHLVLRSLDPRVEPVAFAVEAQRALAAVQLARRDDPAVAVLDDALSVELETVARDQHELYLRLGRAPYAEGAARLYGALLTRPGASVDLAFAAGLLAWDRGDEETSLPLLERVAGQASPASPRSLRRAQRLVVVMYAARVLRADGPDCPPAPHTTVLAQALPLCVARLVSAVDAYASGAASGTFEAVSAEMFAAGQLLRYGALGDGVARARDVLARMRETHMDGPAWLIDVGLTALIAADEVDAAVDSLGELERWAPSGAPMAWRLLDHRAQLVSALCGGEVSEAWQGTDTARESFCSHSQALLVDYEPPGVRSIGWDPALPDVSAPEGGGGAP